MWARPLSRAMLVHDFTAELVDFADTAGLVMALDLVISVDTAGAHLVGALVEPLWLLNRFNTCCRWLLERTVSSWYPIARLFRQQRFGDWDGPIADVAVRLRDWMADPRRGDSFLTFRNNIRHVATDMCLPRYGWS